MKVVSLAKSLKEVIKPVNTILLDSDTVFEALKKLRKKKLDSKIVYFYVVDEEKRLQGIIPTRTLLLADREVKISQIMETPVIKLKINQTLQDAIEYFAKYTLLALPVVDEEEKLLGIVDVEVYLKEPFDIADARHRNDVFQLIGISLEDEKKVSILKSYRFRMPWIFCNLFGGTMCAIISRINELVIAKVLLLAMFIPLVLTLSESVSMQSMTHSLQFIRRPHFSIGDCLKKGVREWQIIGLIALSSAIIVGFVSIFWDGGIAASFSIASGILVSVFISGSFGLTFPIILHKLNLDPKVASGPVVLMFADVLTTAIYLGLASWWLL